MRSFGMWARGARRCWFYQELARKPSSLLGTRLWLPPSQMNFSAATQGGLSRHEIDRLQLQPEFAEAFRVEYQALKDTEAVEIVRRDDASTSSGAKANILQSFCLRTLKRDGRARARFIVNGQTDQRFLDHLVPPGGLEEERNGGTTKDEDHAPPSTAAPTAQPVTQRLVLSLCAARQWAPKCSDVRTAFLQADWLSGSTRIYTEIPRELQPFALKDMRSGVGLAEARKPKPVTDDDEACSWLPLVLWAKTETPTVPPVSSPATAPQQPCSVRKRHWHWSHRSRFPYLFRLRKPVNGIRDGPAKFHASLRGHLVKTMGFRESAFDPCLFLYYAPSSPEVLRGFCMLHVDDILHAGDDYFYDFVWPQLSDRFRLGATPDTSDASRESSIVYLGTRISLGEDSRGRAADADNDCGAPGAGRGFFSISLDTRQWVLDIAEIIERTRLRQIEDTAHQLDRPDYLKTTLKTILGKLSSLRDSRPHAILPLLRFHQERTARRIFADGDQDRGDGQSGGPGGTEASTGGESKTVVEAEFRALASIVDGLLVDAKHNRGGQGQRSWFCAPPGTTEEEKHGEEGMNTNAGGYHIRLNFGTPRVRMMKDIDDEDKEKDVARSFYLDQACTMELRRWTPSNRPSCNLRTCGRSFANAFASAFVSLLDWDCVSARYDTVATSLADNGRLLEAAPANCAAIKRMTKRKKVRKNSVLLPKLRLVARAIEKSSILRGRLRELGLQCGGSRAAAMHQNRRKKKAARPVVVLQIHCGESEAALARVLRYCLLRRRPRRYSWHERRRERDPCLKTQQVEHSLRRQFAISKEEARQCLRIISHADSMKAVEVEKGRAPSYRADLLMYQVRLIPRSKNEAEKLLRGGGVKQ